MRRRSPSPVEMIEQIYRVGKVQQVIAVGIAKNEGIRRPWRAAEERQVQKNNCKYRISMDHRPGYLISDPAARLRAAQRRGNIRLAAEHSALSSVLMRLEELALHVPPGKHVGDQVENFLAREPV